MLARKASYSWWWDSRNSGRRSPWLQSTLSELDVKTKAMLELIEEDADSFAQRAEMYYKKRPELVNMVENIYRAHRSLAERYDQLKYETGNRPAESIFSVKIPTDRASEISYHSYDSDESEVDDPEPEDTQVEECKYRENTARVYCEDGEECKNDSELAELRIEIVRLQEENRAQKVELEERSEEKREVIRQNTARVFCEDGDAQVEECNNDSELAELRIEIERLQEENRAQKVELEKRSEEKRELIRQNTARVYCEDGDAQVEECKNDSELAELRIEIERLQEENRAQKVELEERSEEKREVIRQLCLSMEMLKEENAILKKYIKDSRKWSLFEFYKWKNVFSGKKFKGISLFQPGLVAV